MGNTEQRVRDITVKYLEVDPTTITAGARFVEDLGADSLATIELTLALEDEFDITITDQEASDHRTFAAVVALIDSKRSTANER